MPNMEADTSHFIGEQPEEAKLAFPVIYDFAIERFGLYPGASGQGIRFRCQPGVSIIAGINGLGKTTMLTALFRALSGPVDWAKRRIGAPAGNTPIQLGAWRDPQYFRNRVADAADEATITIDFGLGSRRIQVSRALSSLAILKLTADGVELKPEHGEYQRVVCESAGLAKYDDFFLLLRYLVFFLEERPALVWDPDAQADILRVLFFDPQSVVRARTLFDEVQRKDSEYRNTRAQANRFQQRIASAAQASDASTAVLSEIASLSTVVQAREEEAEALGRQIDEADAERRSQRLLLEQAKMRLAEVQQLYAHMERAHFAQIFPSASEIANQILVQVGTGGGCLVCGTKTSAAMERVRVATESHHCPLCDSIVVPAPPEPLMDLVVPGSELTIRRLEAADREVTEAQGAVAGREQAYLQAVDTYQELERHAVRLQRDLSDASGRLESLQARLPADDAHIADWRKAFNALDADARRQRSALAALEADFYEVLAAGEARVRKISELVARRFRDFASYFLAEECDLEYVIDRRSVGEVTRRFDFPRFIVRLTSASSPDAKQPRRTISEVSESQREFLDLAFRMALMEVASDGSPLMLVLETPEASLDSVFVRRAGDLFGRFAHNGKENRIIATSNLTRGEMIGALLGAVAPLGETPEDLPHYVPPEKRESRLVNLLRDAAQNRALDEYREEYEDDLQVALYPETRGKNGPS